MEERAVLDADALSSTLFGPSRGGEAGGEREGIVPARNSVFLGWHRTMVFNVVSHDGA